jgi:hypothetical protein
MDILDLISERISTITFEDINKNINNKDFIYYLNDFIKKNKLLEEFKDSIFNVYNIVGFNENDRCSCIKLPKN